MTTYYRDPQVHITSDGIRVDGNWYPIAELTAIGHLRQRRPLRHGSMLLATVGLFVALALSVLLCAGLGLAAAWHRPAGERAAAALVALAALAVVATLAGRAAVELPLNLLDRLHLHGTARHELHAAWRGRDVVVFASEDAHRFGKVYRSLRRAVEQRDASARRQDRRV